MKMLNVTLTSSSLSSPTKGSSVLSIVSEILELVAGFADEMRKGEEFIAKG